MKRIILIAAATCSLGTAGTVSAVGEWRYMDTAAPAAAERTVVAVVEGVSSDVPMVPRNYMTMAAVTEMFGEPANQAPAVGQPPITRWYYPGYTVYFEYDRVITSVLN